MVGAEEKDSENLLKAGWEIWNSKSPIPYGNIAKESHTLIRARVCWPSNLFIVKADVKVAVNIEQTQMPIRIQNIANTRPGNERGARSP